MKWIWFNFDIRANAWRGEKYQWNRIGKTALVIYQKRRPLAEFLKP